MVDKEAGLDALLAKKSIKRAGMNLDERKSKYGSSKPLIYC